MKVQSNGLSQAEILQLIQGSPQQGPIKTEYSSGSDMEIELVDVVPTALPTKIKHLRWLSLSELSQPDADASSSPAVSGSSDPEVDLQDESQEKEAIKAGEQSSTFSTEDTSTSTNSRASDLLNETLEMEVIGGVPGESSTSTGTDGPSSSPEGKPSDLETSGGFNLHQLWVFPHPKKARRLTCWLNFRPQHFLKHPQCVSQYDGAVQRPVPGYCSSYRAVHVRSRLSTTVAVMSIWWMLYQQQAEVPPPPGLMIPPQIQKADSVEDSNYLSDSLVISPQGCLVDSLQLYFKTSSFECSCSECAGTMASEAMELISRPREQRDESDNEKRPKAT
ncbi:hypothetical protein Q8A67_021817 [Cirrhinus molitorella]|uniref:Uncharacterized protein n=1 Tax=Cirrhinus molitorella TaxID=172907 RepID=A0AA88P4A3_9TELE|nr:hypothetical protein Q8A67_021817 [Cirrhinus molitorella]